MNTIDKINQMKDIYAKYRRRRFMTLLTGLFFYCSLCYLIYNYYILYTTIDTVFWIVLILCVIAFIVSSRFMKTSLEYNVYEREKAEFEKSRQEYISNENSKIFSETYDFIMKDKFVSNDLRTLKVFLNTKADYVRFFNNQLSDFIIQLKTWLIAYKTEVDITKIDQILQEIEKVESFEGINDDAKLLFINIENNIDKEGQNKIAHDNLLKIAELVRDQDLNIKENQARINAEAENNKESIRWGVCGFMATCLFSLISIFFALFYPVEISRDSSTCISDTIIHATQVGQDSIINKQEQIISIVNDRLETGKSK